MKTPILSTSNLSKSIKKEQILCNVSITIHENTIYGLLGENGAGKSTILKLLVGILRPTTGSIIFNGKEWSRNDLEAIGFLIEHPPLYGNLSASENLKVHTTLLGLPDSRINKVLKIVGLVGVNKKRVAKYSLGMKQRLGIAIAILNNPKLLILDEPTNGLDPLGIQELRELIKSFKVMGMTVIISSHNLSEISQLVDEIGIIHQGKLAYQGEVSDSNELENLFINVVKNSEVIDK